MNIHRFIKLALLVAMLPLLLSACSSGTPSLSTNRSKIAMAEMPDFVQNAQPLVQQAYQYAVTNPDALKTVPCFCGCVNMGHTSNLDCYIKATSADGKITFDNHAAFCGICVDITNDVMRLRTQGKSAREIRGFIDTKYGSSGPSTNTVMPID